MSENYSPRGEPRGDQYSYSLRSECCTKGESCGCNSTLCLTVTPRHSHTLRCSNVRNINSAPRSTLTSVSSNDSTSALVSSLKNGSSARHVHFKDLNGPSQSAPYSAEPAIQTNGHATGTNIDMSTTSSTTKITRTLLTSSSQKLGSRDGSFVSLSNSNKSFRNEGFAHPGYRNRTYVSETVESVSGQGFVSEKRIHKDLNGSGLVSDVLVSDDDNEDDFLHRKTSSNLRRRYTSDGFDIGQTKQSVYKEALYVPVTYLSKIAWYIYSAIVQVLVFEKWFLKSSTNTSTYQEDLYYYNKRMGYASNGTNEESSSNFKHFFFGKKKSISNVNNSNERRNVMVYNNSNENKSTKTTYNNSKSQHNEDHLSDEEQFSSSWNRSRGLCLGCLKIFGALLLLAILGYMAYLLWSPISALASSTSEFVGSCLSSIITLTVGVLHYLGSLSLFGSGKTSEPIAIIPIIPVTEESANVQTASSINPIPPIISKEELDGILSRLQFLEQKIVDHDNKFVLYDAKYNELKVHISQLELAMQEASAKGKTPDQILMEIMNFQLGETTDGKVVTLSNLVTLWNTKTQDEKSTLDMKLKTLAEEIAAYSDTSNSKTDQIKGDIIELQGKQTQTEAEIKILHKPVEVDMGKLQESILPVLMSEIGSQVKMSCSTRDCPEPTPGGGIVGGTEADLAKLIKMAIAKYDADKTGLPDLALESAGGTILSTRCTKSSKLRNSVVSFFGFKIWSPPNNPRTIIQPGVVPGECWAFEGSVGDIVIQLVAPSIVNGFTVEHISKSVSPYKNIDSAPYKFEVWGLNAENDFDTMWQYGSYSYEDNGETLQYFPVQNPSANAYPIVELKILSNHGNLRHTCLYRFRVHGALDMKVMNVKIEPHTSEV